MLGKCFAFCVGMASKSDRDIIEELLKSTAEVLRLVNKEQRLTDSDIRLIRTYTILLNSDAVELKTYALLRKACTHCATKGEQETHEPIAGPQGSGAVALGTSRSSSLS